ncbi:MAG: DUF4347 domain-containing protein, partial [Cyanobacteria bacterium P01_C01_bin.69]
MSHPNTELSALSHHASAQTLTAASFSGLANSTANASPFDRPSGTSGSIAFVDAGLVAINELISGLGNTQVVLIEAGEDGIAKMTSTLANASDLAAVHVFSHGGDGLLQLGNTLLSNENVAEYGKRLQQWSSALTTEADLMIYGCNLAAGADGLSLMGQLGELTGADVAASDDVTGAGGDWILESSTGKIESNIVVSEAVQASYKGKLDLLSNGGFESGLVGWNRFKDIEQVVTVGAFAGTRALKLSVADSGAEQIVDAVAGATYEMSAYAKSTSNQYVGFGITFYDAVGDEIEDGSAIDRSIGSADWRQYGGEAVAPDNAEFVRFWVYKSNGVGDGLFDQLALTLTNIDEPVVDEDPGVIGLATSQISAGEGDGTVNVSVNRTSGSDGEVTVDYRTVVGSAKAGSDYEAISGTLTFADGQTQQSVDISLVDNNSPEELETFGFAIDNVRGGATLLAPRTAQITIADDDGFTYKGNQYAVTTAKTWQQAQNEAEQLGGNLVSINTAREEAWLKETFGDTEGFWIGLNDVETEGEFEWASGEQVTYTNWAPGEPNDGGIFGSQDYGWMNFSRSRQWDDNYADETLRGIVEIGDFNGPVLGNGNGLKGEYYNNIDFTDLAISRTDATVNFDWGNGSPSSQIAADTFSTRWTGKIEPLYSETYTFTTTSDDGVRLWVNNELIIDAFRDQPSTDYTGTITLNAGQQYDIQMDYYENGGEAVSKLAWSSASQASEIVPRSQLYSDPVDSRILDSETVISGLTQPIAIDWLTDGSNKMFVAEKSGVVKIFENGSVLSNPFIDISDQVNGTRDRGLLDIAIHPDFDNNPYVYLLFTYDPPEVNDFSG